MNTTTNDTQATLGLEAANEPMTRGEAAAWARAGRLAEEHLDTLFYIYKVPGGFDVLMAGVPAPANSKLWGGVREYSKPIRAYTVQEGGRQRTAML